MKRALVIALVAYALHFAWEMAHGGLFETMTRLPFWTATAWCARAAAWDVVSSFASYAAASAASRDVLWPGRLRAIPLAIYLVTGIAITIAIERWAVDASRWKYAEEMLAIGGIGLSPLLQCDRDADRRRRSRWRTDLRDGATQRRMADRVIAAREGTSSGGGSS